MSWAWTAPLALGALAAVVLGRLGRALERERAEVVASRLRLAELPVGGSRRRRPQ